MSSKKSTETEVSVSMLCIDMRGGYDERRMPSSSEDLTFASITSPANGRNTTRRKMTLSSLISSSI